MITTCPFCGAALKQVFPQSSVSVFTCKTVTQEGGGRGLQTIACVEAEVARLTKERDEARERVKRLEEELEADAFDLVTYLRRQMEFSARTFGPGDRTEGIVDHILKELNEVLDDQQAGKPTLSEWIDVIILAFDGACCGGATPPEIIEAMVAKQAKNEARTWPDWRTVPAGKAIEHDRSGDRPEAKEAKP